MTLSQRDIFEGQYIMRHMAADPYQEAKESLESLRFELTYSDPHLDDCYHFWILGVEFDEIDMPLPEGCKLCNVATGCDGSCY